MNETRDGRKMKQQKEEKKNHFENPNGKIVIGENERRWKRKHIVHHWAIEC